MKHKHHLIPLYRGGLDMKENLVEVSVTQHAMFHYCNWRLWEDDRDRLAWKGLTGEIGKEEIIRELRSIGAKKANREHIYTEKHINLLKEVGKKYHRQAVEASKSSDAIKKKKETLAKINHQQGTKNSQYGTMWITDGTKSGSYKIKRGDKIPAGYKPGRILK
jgi:hypothetical protein